MYRILIVVILFLAVACGPQKKLQRSYIGKTLAAIEAELGKPTTSFDKKEGKMYIFEKVEHLRSTEISQHKLTLDPMVTPRVKKTERYFITVVDGIISDVKVEEEYER